MGQATKLGVVQHFQHFSFYNNNTNSESYNHHNNENDNDNDNDNDNYCSFGVPLIVRFMSQTKSGAWLLKGGEENNQLELFQANSASVAAWQLGDVVEVSASLNVNVFSSSIRIINFD